MGIITVFLVATGFFAIWSRLTGHKVYIRCFIHGHAWDEKFVCKKCGKKWRSDANA